MSGDCDCQPNVGPAASADAASGSEDARLVALCLQGQASAWRGLVLRHQRVVFAVARRAGLDDHDAADVLQTVFARLFEHLGRLAQPERLHAWVVTTARRETLALLRHRQRWRSGPGGDADEEDPLARLPDSSPLAEQRLSDLQQAHHLRLALDDLDERCRTLLSLLFADEDERLPYGEIGQRLGIAQGSIGPTRGRCLDKLRRRHQRSTSPERD